MESVQKTVVRLVKALHGHPDAGNFWEQHCDESLRSMGFQPVGGFPFTPILNYN